MKHNHYNFQTGDTVLLDEEYVNWSIVEIVSLSLTGCYAEVREPFGEDTWRVMTNRLTPCERGITINKK